ncbi:MAG: ABC transporter ATP-binding protein [Lachnospiraceae bacterium]|nr:ABC transporter ATP-binding protein [Lachnospiraceae bacterium]
MQQEEAYFFSIEQLIVGYRNVPVVRDVDVMLAQGEILTLIGGNGAGKSTILRSIMGQLTPLSGVVYLEEKSIHEMSAAKRAQDMAVVLTERVKGDYMTCEDVVSMGRYPYTGMLGILSAADKEKVRQTMELVGIAGLADKDFATLSDGQKQLTMLARALCQEPKLMILDEPTSYLDMRYKLELLTILQRMAREKKLTVIMSLHELELAQRISDKIMCIKGGKVERLGTAEEIFRENYIAELYDLRTGSYDGAECRPELPRIEGEPKVFVIAGGGSGAPIYRSLQRQGIPFATGILQKNDLDYPVAEKLAARVVCVEAFAELDEASVQEALAVMESCERVICTVERFGTQNQANRKLLESAKEKL